MTYPTQQDIALFAEALDADSTEGFQRYGDTVMSPDGLWLLADASNPTVHQVLERVALLDVRKTRMSNGVKLWFASVGGVANQVAELPGSKLYIVHL